MGYDVGGSVNQRVLAGVGRPNIATGRMPLDGLGPRCSYFEHRSDIAPQQGGPVGDAHATLADRPSDRIPRVRGEWRSKFRPTKFHGELPRHKP